MKEFFHAYHDAEYAATNLAGLTTALSDLARETPAIAHKEYDTRSLMALIITIEEKALAMESLFAAMWEAHKAERKAAE